jgi:hypothetical protein
MPPKKKLTKKEIESAVASGQITYKDPKSKGRRGYEVRLVAENTFVTDTYPGFTDHPSPEGSVEYDKHVDTSEAATVWEAITNENYAKGGIPVWIRKELTDLDLSIYWQLTYHQRVWGGTAYPSFKTLSRNLGCQYRSVQRSIKRLLDVGVIVQKRKSSGRSPNRFQVILFSQIEPPPLSPVQKMADLETTGGVLETTGEHAIGDPVVVQKTKPLKGRVADAPAKAALSAPRKKNSVPILQTIDEASNSRKQRIAQTRINERPRIIRPFHPNEVTENKLLALLKDVDFLANNWEKTKELAKVSGSIDFKLLRILPAPESEDQGLARYCANRLTSASFDVNNLPKSLDLILKSYLMQKEKVSNELAYELNQAIRKKEVEDHRKEQLRENEESRLAMVSEQISSIANNLSVAHQFLQKVVPNFADLVNAWGGGSSALGELEPGGKENGKLLPVNREVVGRVVSQIPIYIKEICTLKGFEINQYILEDLIEYWFRTGSIETGGTPIPINQFTDEN